MLGITVLALSALVGNALSAPAQLQTSMIAGVEWSVKDFTRGSPLPSQTSLLPFSLIRYQN